MNWNKSIYMLTIFIVILILLNTKSIYGKKSSHKKLSEERKELEVQCGLKKSERGDIKRLREKIGELSDVLEKNWNEMQRGGTSRLSKEEERYLLERSSSCIKLAIKSDPNDYQLYTQLGKVMAFQNDWEGSIYSLTQGLRVIYTKYSNIYEPELSIDDLILNSQDTTLSESNLEIHNLPSFSILISKINNIDRERLVEVHLSIASILKMQTRYNEAELHLKRSSLLEPKSKGIKSEIENLGSCPIQKGTAEELRTQAMKSWSRGAQEEATNCLDILLSIEPSDYEALYIYSQYYATFQNYKQCVAYTQKSLDFYPVHPEELDLSLSEINTRRKDFMKKLQDSFKKRHLSKSQIIDKEEIERELNEILELVKSDVELSMKERIQLSSILNMKAFCESKNENLKSSIDTYQHALVILNPLNSLYNDPRLRKLWEDEINEENNEGQVQEEEEEEEVVFEEEEEKEQEQEGDKIYREWNDDEEEKRKDLMIKIMTNLAFAFDEIDNFKESERWFALAIQESDGANTIAINGLEELHKKYESLNYGKMSSFDQRAKPKHENKVNLF